MMSDEAWAAMSAVLGAGGLYKLAELAARYLERRKETRSHDTLRNVRSIYNTMQVTLEEVGAQRLALLMMHNGGGPLKTSGPMYSSVHHEVWVPPLKPKLYEWGRERPDHHYSALISDVVERGAVTVVTATMPEGKLRDLYTSDSVVLSLMVHVATLRGEIYYLSCNYTADTASGVLENETELRGHLRAAASKIRGLL